MVKSGSESCIYKDTLLNRVNFDNQLVNKKENLNNCFTISKNIMTSDELNQQTQLSKVYLIFNLNLNFIMD